MEGILTQEEIALAQRCIGYSLAAGASAVRITLNKSQTDLVGMLNGEVDKVTHSLDRRLTLCLFADGRYGTFSLNRLSDEEAVREFIRSGIDTVRMLVPDPCRRLPDASRKVKDAVTGQEAGLFDAEGYASLDAARRLELSRASSLWDRRETVQKGFVILSEEGEYSDSVYDTLILDSEGLCCRHTETSFEIGYEVTVADPDGNRFSGFWWDATARLDDLMPSIRQCSENATERAAAQIGPVDIPGGRMKIAVRSDCASKLLNPIFNALGGYALQQQNSFLGDTLGKAVFSERLTVRDLPRSKGETGAKWFDSEGVASFDTPLIDKGVVRQYFINTYISGKMGLEPTIEDCTRPVVSPTGDCTTEQDVLELLEEGILVTGFNGGNNNTATGDFSYGIEGFAFSGGKITHPVREMLMTGNFLSLWKNLVAVADDARPCLTRRIPTLAFKDVDIR